MEMQYVVPSLGSKYDIHLAPGQTGKKMIEGALEQFTAATGKLQLVFIPRKI